MMSSRAGRSRGIAGGVSLLAMCIAGALHAQNAAPAETTELATVVVTGTNIRGAEPVGNTVQVISAEQIRDSGKATI
ncbi:hypothetical protein, partial [Candidatus Paracaedibacter symbiosus]|uniref:hypothetical protein n=1 Tax=Candidatus Paracaedibacter symbiosus TaxID=244582 RepID=UPI0012EC94BE